MLDYLRRQVEGRLEPGDATHLRYPTAISRLLGIELVEIAERRDGQRSATAVRSRLKYMLFGSSVYAANGGQGRKPARS